MLISTYLNFKDLSIDEKIDILSSIKLDGVSIKVEDISDLEYYSQNKIEVLNCEIDSRGYAVDDESAHQEFLNSLERIVKILKNHKIKALTVTIPKADITSQFDILMKKITDYYEILKKNKIDLIVATSTDYKANEFAYIFKNNKKIKLFSFDCDKLYNNNQAVLTSFRILKDYIQILKVSDRKEGIPTLIGYGDYKLLDIFKTMLTVNKKALIELKTNLLELEKKAPIQTFFSKKAKTENKNYQILEDKIGEITPKNIIVNQSNILIKALK